MLSKIKTFIKKFLFASATLFISANVAYAAIPEKSKVSANDSTSGYLNGKLVAGTGITFTENSDGGNETLTIANGLGTADGAAACLFVEGSTADNAEQIICSVDPTGDRTFYLPNAEIAAGDVLCGSAAQTSAYCALANTQILIGDGSGVPTSAALSGDMTMTNAGVTTIANNAVALSTDTTGAFVAGVTDAGNSTVSVSGSGSENASVTLDVVDVNCTACLSATELAADSVSSSELNAAGVEAELEAVLDLDELQGAVTDAQVPNNITITSASSTENTDYGTLTDGKVCIYDLTNTEIDCTADTSGVGDMLKATYDADEDGEVSEAEALAANGTNCSAGEYARGVDASGNAENCTAVGAGLPATDTTSVVEGSGDNTKEIRFEVDGLTTGTVRVITPPDENFTMVGVATTQTLTGKTLAAADNVIAADTAEAMSGAGQIDDTDLAAGAVDGGNAGEIADGSITADDLGADSVEASEIAAGAVGTSEAANLDIGDDTNLAAGRSLTLSGDSVEADVELYTTTRCVRFESPTAADDMKSIWINDSANGFTVTKLWCESDQTVTTMLQVDDGSPADMDGTDLVCISTPDTDTSLDGDATVAAGDRLDIDVASVASTPTWVTICWTGTYDD